MKWIYLFEPADGCEPLSDMSLIDQTLDSLAALPCPSHPTLNVTCSYMRPPPPPEDYSNRAPSTGPSSSMRPMWLVQASSSQCLVDREAERITLVDASMIELIDKKLDFKEKNVVKIEGRGYELGGLHGGLILSSASVTHTAAAGGQASFLGHIIEVEVKEHGGIEVIGEWPRDNVSRSMAETLNEALSWVVSQALHSSDARKASLDQLKTPRFHQIEGSSLENMAKKSAGGRYGSMQAAFYYCEVAALLLKRQQKGS